MKSNAGMKFPFESARLILNPTSGRRRAAGFGREIAAALSAAGLDVGVFEDSTAAKCYSGEGGRFDVEVPAGEIEIEAFLESYIGDIDLEGSIVLFLEESEIREVIFKLAPEE